MKIVINSDFGGFGLSNAAFERYLELSGIEYEAVHRAFGVTDYWAEGFVGEDEHYLSYYDLARNDPLLVQVVEEMGGKACGSHSSLKVVEIPDDVDWMIQEYDGCEHIAEVHRTWR